MKNGNISRKTLKKGGKIAQKGPDKSSDCPQSGTMKNGTIAQKV
jgi:hypothetical protein